MRGDRLQQARERAGMTREELAEKVGKSYVTVGTWERGARKPKAEMLPVLASALNVSVDYLLGIDTEESTDARRNIDTAVDPLEELMIVWQSVKDYPDAKGFFSQISKFDPDTIRRMARVLETIFAQDR